MDDYLSSHLLITTFIMEASDRVRVSQTVKTTACMLYHKVVKNRIDRQVGVAAEPYLLAATCLYLASKIEEEPQKIRDVVNVCYRVLHPTSPALEIGKAYWNLRDSVINCELMLLRLFQFEVAMESPQKHLLHFLKSLQDWVPSPSWAESKVAQTSWNILNDCCHLPLISLCPAALLSSAAIYIAVASADLLILDRPERRWWQVFCPDVSESELQGICSDILLLYEFQNKHK